MARAAAGLLVYFLVTDGGAALTLSSLYSSQRLQRDSAFQVDSESQHFQRAVHPSTKGGAILEVEAPQLRPFGVEKAKRPEPQLLLQENTRDKAHQQAMMHQGEWSLISDYTAKFMRNVAIIAFLVVVGVAFNYMLKSTEPDKLRGAEKVASGEQRGTLAPPSGVATDDLKAPGPASKAAPGGAAGVGKKPAEQPPKADAEEGAETDATTSATQVDDEEQSLSSISLSSDADQVAGPPSPPLPRVEPAKKEEEPPAEEAASSSAAAPPAAPTSSVGGWLSRRRQQGCGQQRGGFMALAGHFALLACGQSGEAQRAREAAAARVRRS